MKPKPRIYKVCGKWYCQLKYSVGFDAYRTAFGIAADSPALAYARFADANKDIWPWLNSPSPQPCAAVFPCK